MAKQRISASDVSTNEILHVLNADIAQGKVVAVDVEYLETLKNLVKDVSINIDDRLPDDESSP